MMEKQRGLLRKARDSVKAARLLSGEGMHDFAVSRAYYAMFYAAEAFLEGRGLTYSKHSAVHAAFGQHFAKPGIVPAELHRYLLDASDARAVGDYDVGPELTREDAALHIERADEFIRIAEERIDQLSS
ncbi:MAG: HEPN domain-containing protein [Gemmatimonadota bacterium]